MLTEANFYDEKPQRFSGLSISVVSVTLSNPGSVCQPGWAITSPAPVTIPKVFCRDPPVSEETDSEHKLVVKLA